ncbi:hypothetical protein GQ457_10G016760 [Hibiscus cannabinus]
MAQEAARGVEWSGAVQRRARVGAGVGEKRSWYRQVTGENPNHQKSTIAPSIFLFLSSPSKTLRLHSTSTNSGCSCSLAVYVSNGQKPARRKRLQVVSMAPEEEKLTRRNPLDLPIG